MSCNSTLNCLAFRFRYAVVEVSLYILKPFGNWGFGQVGDSGSADHLVKFDIFRSFSGLATQRGWTKGLKEFFFIAKGTLRSGTEVNRGT